ncbi:MAG: alpha/beta hydrolase [Candidatus Nanopelagicales bacterium]
MKRLVVLCSLLLTACSNQSGSVIPPPSLPDTLESFYSQDLTWKECRGIFECADVQVPLDYNDFSKGTITLSVMKKPAEGSSRGAIFTNPGGPGGSGIQYLESYSYAFSRILQKNFDLVSWDPRGVNESSPVDCLTDSELDFYGASEPTPDNPAEIEAFKNLTLEFSYGCLENSPEILSHISTTETVKDLDILRELLAQPKLNYIGKSYGTLIGAHYAEMFPNRVGKFVLDGAVDPSLTTRELALGQAVGFDDALSRFAKYCFDLESSCELGNSERVIIKNIMDFLNRLDQEPLKTNDPNRPLTESLGWVSVYGPLYAPSFGWDWLISGLEEAYQGDGTNLLEIADWISSRNSNGTYSDNSTEAYWSITCLDNGPTTELPNTFEKDFISKSPYFGRALAWSEAGCLNWPVIGEKLSKSITASGAPPILVIGTTHDPATPDSWARSLAEQLSVGIYVNFNGDGHTAYMSGSKCINTLVDEFILNDVIPEVGTSCEPNNPLVAP